MFQWEIKENPKWKTCFWEGGKNSSEFLSSCNEDNLIKIKAKLTKNLKVQVFGCIISLKHGRMGLLSLAEVPGCADRWCSHQWIWMEMYSWIAVLWPLLLAFLLFLSLSALLLLKQKTKKKKCYFGRQFPFSPMSFIWVCSWGQTIWELLSFYSFYSWISWFIPRSCHFQVEKETVFTHTPP